MAEHKPPQGSAGSAPVPTHAAPPSPRQSETQSQQTRRPAPLTPFDSQKSQIRDYFRSQGKQPEDVIWDLQGLQLRLKDLD